MEKNTVYFEDNTDVNLSEGLEIFLREHGYALSADKKEAAICVVGRLCTEKKLKIVKQKEECVIYYEKKAHFFRGASLMLQNSQNRISFWKKFRILNQMESCWTVQEIACQGLKRSKSMCSGLRNLE